MYSQEGKNWSTVVSINIIYPIKRDIMLKSVDEGGLRPQSSGVTSFLNMMFISTRVMLEIGDEIKAQA